MNRFERYLSFWVAACMVAGVVIGKLLPGLVDGLRRLEFGQGSQINVPIAALIWLMIVPMIGGRAGNRCRRPHRGTGHAVGLLSLQSNATLVPRR